ncbi:MAG: hypothetical protein QHG99_06885 [Methanomicrobiales archaeon]|nr:hypothetical protein [Methanomicrobiales archaeon]
MYSVKDEEVDWLVYCALAGGDLLSRDELSSRTGLDSSLMEPSLDRLSKAHLVERSGGSVRILALPEIMMRYHLASSEDLPYYLEDNVIRLRKRQGST